MYSPLFATALLAAAVPLFACGVVGGADCWRLGRPASTPLDGVVVGGWVVGNQCDYETPYMIRTPKTAMGSQVTPL